MSPSFDLPEDVMIEILSRFSIKHLLRLRSVSKSWYALLTSPNFIRSHLRRSNSEKLLVFSDRLVSNYDPNHIRSLSIYCRDDDDDDDDLSSNIPLTLFPFDSTGYVNIVGSCNGLVCVHGIIDGKPSMVLWNPATRHFRYIELHRESALSSPLTFFGFGFLPDTDDYKIVEFKFPFRLRNSVGISITIPVLVYTLSLDYWKVIEVDVPDLNFSNRAIAMNGFLHWMGCVPDKLVVIVSFDLRNEVFGQMRVPDSCGFGHEINRELLVLKGSISVIVCGKREQIGRWFEIWVMTEYGVKESWTKLFRIAPFSRVVDLEPMGSWNGEIIFLYPWCWSDELFSYDPSTEKTERFRVPLGLLRAFNYVESVESVEGGEKRSSRRWSSMTGYLGIQMAHEQAGDGETPSNDIGWKFANLVPNNRRTLHCKLCGMILYGGITQLKQHLAHKKRRVSPCPYVSSDIREQMMKHLRGFMVKRNKKRERRKVGTGQIRVSHDDDDDNFDFKCLTDSSDDSDLETTIAKQDTA